MFLILFKQQIGGGVSPEINQWIKLGLHGFAFTVLRWYIMIVNGNDLIYIYILLKIMIGWGVSPKMNQWIKLGWEDMGL